MARPTDLEFFRELMRDNRLHVGLGKITQLGVASDRSVLRVQLSVFPEEREIIAMMTWETVGVDAGFYRFPKVGDLVLFAQVEGDYEQAFVIKRLSSKEDTIPAKALDGHTVIQTEAGAEEIFLSSDKRLNLGKRNSVPLEPLVLGLVLQDFLDNFLAKFKGFISDLKSGPISLTTTPGNPTAPEPAFVAKLTQLESDIDSLKSTYVTTESSNILSKLAFTERGGE